MDLLRLPLVVLSQVFKNMSFKEKFFISLLSKRARNTLKLTAEIPDFSFLLSNDFYIHYHLTFAINEYPSYVFMGETVKNCCIGGEEMRLTFNENGVILRDQPFRKQMILANHVLDSFRKPTFYVKCYNQTEPAFVWEFMKMINQRQLSIKSFDYDVAGNSSEFIPRILDECTEVTDHVFINVCFPDDFLYTPARPFKATKLSVCGKSNWLNLESFVNCRCITIQLDVHSYQTAQTYQSFSKNGWIRRFDYKRGTEREIKKYWTEFKMRNESEFFIYACNNCIGVHTKQAYLEFSKKDKPR
uniref:F-box domain-containing protein n=1 Tax=Caenorhabditis tropicalis TaxID=1561998 RepID=A0A1I7UTA4_9PELO